MTQIKNFQVDAFAERVFKGNPAAVCPLEKWLPDEQMQSIAMENNLAETAFVHLNTYPYELRWFTPKTEVDLCGHATLATSRILFDEYLPEDQQEINFNSRSGILKSFKQDDKIFLDFQRDTPKPVKITKSLTDALTIKPEGLFKGKDDYLAIFKNETIVKSIKPDFNKIEKLECRGAIISAAGGQVDFVSRFFAPQTGINEDPVTGSAHTLLTPYWVKILQRDTLTAYQCSKRGGELSCKLMPHRVEIGGKSKLYLKGTILL
jgi:PhzF family phenazine biosynthesis protein